MLIKAFRYLHRFIYNDGTHFDYENHLRIHPQHKNICKEDANNYKILLDKSKKSMT